MAKIHINGRNTRDPTLDPTPEEAADVLQRDGLRLEGIAKLQTEWMERTQYAPEQIFADPLPEDAWRQIADRILKERSGMAVDSRVFEDASIALSTARNMDHGTSLWDALVIQCECCEKAYGLSRREAQYILRHNGYKVAQTYAGRNVG